MGNEDENGISTANWISVEERLPEKPYRIVIAYMPEFPGGMKSIKTMTMNDALWSCVTHWMPLPPAPDDRL